MVMRDVRLDSCGGSDDRGNGPLLHSDCFSRRGRESGTPASDPFDVRDATMPWWLAQTKPNMELKLDEELSRMGVARYIPTATSTRMLNRRRVPCVRPIFVGYAFIAVDDTEY